MDDVNKNAMKASGLELLPAVLADMKAPFDTEMANLAAHCHGSEMEDEIKHISFRLKDM